MELELYIPHDFFISANKNNNHESVSEKLSKTVLSEIWNCNDSIIRRGDDKINEPDYIMGEEGYEITFGDSHTTIQTLKQKKVEKLKINTLDTFYKDIIMAIKNKHNRKRKYSTEKTTLMIVCISFHYEGFFELLDMNEFMNRELFCRRNTYLEQIGTLYSEKGMFDNIMIVQFMHNQHIAVTDLKKYYCSNEEYIFEFGIKDLLGIPNYRVTKNNNLLDHKITVIYGK